MEFDHITYESGTGRRSKEVETYNFTRRRLCWLNTASTVLG